MTKSEGETKYDMSQLDEVREPLLPHQSKVISGSNVFINNVFILKDMIHDV